MSATVEMDQELKIQVGSIEYFLLAHKENFLDFLADGPSLAVVYLVTSGQKVSRKNLRDFRENVLDKDDIFQPEFCRNVVFYGGDESELDVTDDAIEELDAWKTKTWTCVRGNATSRVACGPYVFAHKQTYAPWRIYRDFNATFMTTFKPSKDDMERLDVLDAPTAGIDGRVIVPPRSYFRPSKEKPLDGARISVKDNIDIAGHKTTLCNRSWIDLYPPAEQNAVCLQVLIDAGAIVVGKVKLQAMIMREEPLEAVEFTAPFNPRADGYQVPSGSSHGSAAGIGSYDWLDFSLGSDTNGSGRKPAHYNGCFSIRPSTGIMNTNGVIGQFSKFDMPVFFGRDQTKFSDFIKVWYGHSPLLRMPSTQQHVCILWPEDYLPTVNAAQTDLIDKFTSGLEKALDVQRTKISLAQLWKNTCPDNTPGQDNTDIAEYLKLTGSYPYYYDGYYDLEGFRNDFTKKHGKPPFIHRAMQWQWDIAKSITLEERNFYWRRSEIYRKWLLEEVFKASDTSTITIMIFPIEVGQPSYRDAPLPPYYVLSGYASLCMSPILRAPEFTTLLGDIPFDSVVTQREERLPIGASVIGAPGTDLIITELVGKGMLAGNFPQQLKTGPTMY
ncbi:amidase [Pseudovirgaria hyperparasitica]|uniref:Amidase n=1 Tax=Pseudovirgaria hyperparasitica TaxID=470096 RepID=A0A6A6VSG7_9PEZI|nr:amidase [Pseudovirgaria hyperparasitica]KAF2753095.1 amidase [Pseudovirgaria hyperparasitica]